MAYADIEKRKAYQRRYQKQWAIDNPVRFREREKRRRSTPRYKLWVKKSRLKERFGMSLEAYNLLKCLQRNRCSICGNVRKLFVDHDHETGKVRGLLCGGCNGAIGNLNGRLRSAEEYISNPILAQ